MIPKTVIVSSNLNELYIDFWEMVYKSWKHIGINPILILILNKHETVQGSLMYKENIIPFYVKNGMNTAFVSQCIRLLYPAILKKFNNEMNEINKNSNNEMNEMNEMNENNQNSIHDLILISDMDIIPMNKNYFTIPINDSIKNPDTHFYIYRSNILKESKQIAMCYNAGSEYTWGKLFGINNLEDIYTRLDQWYNSIEYSGIHGGKGWSFDQEILYKVIYHNDVNGEHNNFRPNVIELTDDSQKFNRLDREQLQFLLYYSNYYKEPTGVVRTQFSIIFENIGTGKYSDYHMLRPYHKFKKINDAILTNFIK